MKDGLVRILEIENSKQGKPLSSRYSYLRQQLRVMLSMSENSPFQKQTLLKLQDRLHEEYWRSHDSESLSYVQAQKIVDSFILN